jgi:hypothetical protein
MRCCFCDCSCVAIFVADARIYREDPPRVTTSHNRLGLSLLKRIRHGLVVKINGKRRSRVCKALSRILMDYSRARHMPAPIATPHRVPPCEASEGTCVFPPPPLSLSPLMHALAST